MKFQVGDIVLVRHTGEEAEVVELINKKMVMLEAAGVKFPAYADQLDFPYFKRFTEKKKEAAPRSKKFVDDLPAEKKPLERTREDGVWLAFLPVMESDEFGDDVVEQLKVHLVNRTSGGYRFRYTLSYFGEADFELANHIRPFEDFYIHDLPFENLSDSPLFAFDFELLDPDLSKAAHLEASVKLKPKQVFDRISRLKAGGEATFSYLLFEKYPDRPAEPYFDTAPLAAKGYKIYDASQARRHLEPAKHEVDLHIEALAPHHEEMDNFEKLSLQLQTFEKYLDLAVAHHLPSFIVIHGVGTGKLRDEIHEMLRLRKDVKSFVNRYHPAYGYGATEIFLERAGGASGKKLKA